MKKRRKINGKRGFLGKSYANIFVRVNFKKCIYANIFVSVPYIL
nr:MAG TPA: hypothetical protein [Siphoviridae sp. ctngg6]